MVYSLHPIAHVKSICTKVVSILTRITTSNFLSFMHITWVFLYKVVQLLWFRSPSRIHYFLPQVQTHLLLLKNTLEVDTTHSFKMGTGLPKISSYPCVQKGFCSIFAHKVPEPISPQSYKLPTIEFNRNRLTNYTKKKHLEQMFTTTRVLDI